MGMREKLIELLGYDVCKHDCCDDCECQGSTDACIAILKESMADLLISNDVVPVVRCKDCEHWMPGDSMMGDSIDDMQRVGGCPYVRFRRLENDFCCEGERKNNG